MAQLLITGEDICSSILADIQSARTSIKIEQYIVFDDQSGRMLMRALRERVEAGVKVDILFDAVGCRDVRDHPDIKAISQSGARVRYYNSLHLGNLLTPGRWFPRNHAKVMVVDDHILHIGSACFADYMAGWREAHARLEGTIVSEMGQNMISDGDSDDAHPHYRHIVTHPGRRYTIYRELLGRIDAAQKTLILATPYFTPPILLQRAVRRALARGVDVRMLTGEKTDVPIARIVGQTYFKKFLNKGARIFLYRPDVMHAKYAIVDGSWGMVGSVNLDYLSLLRNREATLCIEDEKTLKALAAQFEKDCSAHAREIGRDFWHEVPLIEKVIGYLGRGIKKVL